MNLLRVKEMAEAPIKISRATLRKLAEKLLTGAGITSAPIMIRDIVKYLKTKENFDVFAFDLPEKVSGIHAMDGDKSYIGYNKDQNRHRQRFTVAHEIGHFILGHTRANNDFKFSSRPSVAEEEANTFAAEILMPYQILKADLKVIKDVKTLATKYDVSPDAMWIQIEKCGLLNKF